MSYANAVKELAKSKTAGGKASTGTAPKSTGYASAVAELAKSRTAGGKADTGAAPRSTAYASAVAELAKSRTVGEKPQSSVSSVPIAGESGRWAPPSVAPSRSAEQYSAEAAALESENKALSRKIYDMEQGLEKKDDWSLEGIREQYSPPEANQMDVFGLNDGNVETENTDEKAEIEKRLSQMREIYEENETKIAELRKREEEAKGYYYSSLSQREDYTELSKAGESKREKGIFGTEKGDALYDYINNIGGYRHSNDMEDSLKRLMSGGGMVGKKEPYAQMTEEEIGAYNYLYAKNGKEAADRYLSDLQNTFHRDTLEQDTLNRRLGEEKYEGLDASAIGKAAKAMYWLPAGLNQFVSGAEQLFSEKAVPTSPVQHTSDLVREEAHGQSKALGFMYDLGTTAANMVPSILLSSVTGPAGPVVGAGAMGVSAGGNAYTQKINEGYTPDQAKQYAVLVGASEGALQYVLGGIGKLGGVSAGKIAAKIAKIDNALARIALTAGVKMGSEGLEEGMQELLEPAFAALILGEEYEVNFEDVAYSFLMGAIMGGLFEGGDIVRTETARGGRTSFDAAMDGYLSEGGVDYFEDGHTEKQLTKRWRELQQEMTGDAAVLADIKRQYDMRKAYHRGEELAESGSSSSLVERRQRTEAPVAPAVEMLRGGEPGENINLVRGGLEYAGETGIAGGQPDAGELITAASTDGAGTAADIREGSNILPDGISGRDDGARPGGQAGILAEGSGGDTKRNARNPAAIHRKNLVRDFRLEKTSAKAIGIENGTDEARITVIPQEAWDEEMRSAAAYASSQTGLSVTFVNGLLQVNAEGGIRSAKGILTDSGFYIQADNIKYTVTQITEHEAFHEMSRQNPGLVQSIRDAITEKYSDTELEQIAVAYARAYYGLYDTDTDEGAMLVLEEIMADAYAGINVFGKSAAKYKETVRAETESRGLGQREEGAAGIRGPPTEARDSVQSPTRTFEEEVAYQLQGRYLTEEGKSPAPSTRYSISESFGEEVQEWYDSTKERDLQVSPGYLTIGTTSETLKSIGVRDGKIYWRKSKIGYILLDHPEIDLSVIKTIPEILENPIIVMKSQTQDSSITLYGDVYAADGRPVMAAVSLTPTAASGMEASFALLTSAYGRTNENTKNLIEKSELLYLDPNKNRTEAWLMQLRVQFPSRQPALGSIGTVSYQDGNVKIEGVPYQQYMQNGGNQSADAPTRTFEEEVAYQLQGGKPPAPSTRYSAEESAPAEEATPVENEVLDGDAESSVSSDDSSFGKGAFAPEESSAAEAVNAPEKKTERAKKPKQPKKPVAESKPILAKKDLRKTMLGLFSIPAGKRAELGAIVDQCADRIIRAKKLTHEERTSFFDRMYAEGVMEVEAYEYYAAGRQAIAGGHIYVNDQIRGEFGDDWNDFRKRAFGLGVYLTNEINDPGVDTWNNELSQILPGLFDAEELDGRVMLEHLIEVAEDGRSEKMGLAEYAAYVSENEHVSEDDLLDNLERQMDWALRTFAEKAGLEVYLRDRADIKEAMRGARERAARKESAQRARDRRELSELQQKTLKQLQWLSKNRNRAPGALRDTWNEVLGDIDLFAVGAVSEGAEHRRWTNGEKTWAQLAQIYKDAKESDPNFLPSKELERIVARIDSKKIADMDVGALQDLYKAAVGLRTEFYNRNNVINDEMMRQFADIYDSSKEEISNAPGGYSGRKKSKLANLADKFVNMEQLTPMNVLEKMGGWNPDGSFYSMAKQLEKGERDIRDYYVRANKLLENFLNVNKQWVKKSDGQGKDATWYTLEVAELLELGMGDKPIFGDKVTVYMTPAQKVHLYLESLSADNLRHMTGGRTFVNKELYSKGKRTEALAQGKTIRLAPESVKKIVSDLTAEERELARILEGYYNNFAKERINKVSNTLYGFDKAMMTNYAPIYTNQNYTKSELGVYNATAEGVGNLKERQRSATPSYNLGAFDAFERHVDQTARFVGMAIPARNWTSLLNWRERSNSMGDVITHKWGDEGKRYITDLIEKLQEGSHEERNTVSTVTEKLLSNYISAIFGFNPSIVLKQLGSIPMASAYLDIRNTPTLAQIGRIDRKLIGTYTSELDYRTMGYGTPETKQLKDNPNWTQTNKFARFTFGGGAITAMDGWAASVLWPWAENKVRRDFPELAMGTAEQVNAGKSPFYQKVAEVFDNAVSRSQSTTDETHQGTIRKSKNPIVRAFTMFRSDSAQAYNTIRQKIGEARYYAQSGADKKTTRAARTAAGTAFLSMASGYVFAESIGLLMALWKHKDDRYRDDEDELTAESVIGEMTQGLIESIAGVVVGGEELAQLIGVIITDDNWYGIEVLGGERLNEIGETLYNAAAGMKEIVSDATNLLENDGDLGEYFRRNGNDILGSIKELAQAVVTDVRGIPVNNIEAYLLGLVKWVSPELETAYEDLTATANKNKLKGLEGEALEKRIENILINRMDGAEEETVEELTALYEAGYTNVIPKDTPNSASVNNEDVKLTAFQKQTYDLVWKGTVAGVLDELAAHKEFERADEEARAKMIERLYNYAEQKAKLALFDDFEADSWVGEADAAIRKREGAAEWVAWDVLATGVKESFQRLTGAGIAKRDALELAKKVKDLKPPPGKKAVTDTQRFRVVDASGLSAARKITAIGTFMDNTNMKTAAGEPSVYAKMLSAIDTGLEVREYIDLKELDVVEDYLKYHKAGMDKSAAMDMAADMKREQQAAGKDEWAKSVVKYRAAVDSADNVEDQLLALSAIMGEKEHRRASIARRYMITPNQYVQFREHLADINDNSGVSSEEAKEALGMMLGLTKAQKAVLWQAVTGGAPKNNPYIVSVGEDVEEMMESTGPLPGVLMELAP